MVGPWKESRWRVLTASTVLLNSWFMPKNIIRTALLYLNTAAGQDGVNSWLPEEGLKGGFRSF